MRQLVGGSVLALWLLAVISSFLLFDRLVRIEFEAANDRWIADGRPQGFFWRPPGIRGPQGSMGRGRLVLAWIFRTPPWVAKSPDASVRLPLYRLAVWAGWVLWVAWVILLFRSV